MEFIRKESEQSGAAISKDLIREFFKKIGEFSQMQKIKLVYTYFTGKKPDPNMSEDKILNRILYETEFGQKIKETEEMLNKQKKFKFPWKTRSEMKSSMRKKDMILVFFLNVKNELEHPKLYPIYGGNMVIVRNKPYLLEPMSVLSFGKYKCMIIREMDRKPVSNRDYNAVKSRGDSTESDELLIKATLKAMIGSPKKEINKNMIVVIVIILLLIGGAVWFLSK